MPKFLLYSDLHVRPERLRDCEYVLEKVGQLALEHKVDYVLNGGDTFHTRGLIRTSCFDRLYHHYSEWADSGIKQIILVGNHDQEDKAGDIHPMRVFGNFKGWSVVSRPVAWPDKKLAFFPYLLSITEKDLLKYKGYDAFVHWGIQGAKRNDWNVDSDGVPTKYLRPFRRVFSGHYHYRNSFENVQYIGLPLQQDFGEMGQDKGILVYDQEKEKVEFCEIKGTPKHFEVKVSFDAKGKAVFSGAEEVQEKDFCRVEVEGEKENVSRFTKEDFKKGTGKNCSTRIQRVIRDKSFSRLDIQAAERHSYESLMNKYVSFVETSLNKKRLLDIGKEILRA
jgi:DNA repair exonuclease SbcCD nuclease subunit